MDLKKAAEKINYELIRSRHMNLFGAKIMLQQRSKDVSGNEKEQRRLAQSIALFADALGDRNWEVGMETEPGDVVLDPEGKYRYLYTGSEAMTHTDPLLYPGTKEATYWALIPLAKAFIKIYPDTPDLQVSVKHGEYWWDIDQENIYEWTGETTDECTTPPKQGSEWKIVPLAE